MASRRTTAIAISAGEAVAAQVSMSATDPSGIDSDPRPVATSTRAATTRPAQNADSRTVAPNRPVAVTRAPPPSCCPRRPCRPRGGRMAGSLPSASARMAAPPVTRSAGVTVTGWSSAAHAVNRNTSPDAGRSSAAEASPSQSQSPTVTRSPGSPSVHRATPASTVDPSTTNASRQPSPSTSAAGGVAAGQSGRSAAGREASASLPDPRAIVGPTRAAAPRTITAVMPATAACRRRRPDARSTGAATTGDRSPTGT